MQLLDEIMYEIHILTRTCGLNQVTISLLLAAQMSFMDNVYHKILAGKRQR